ncbi:hypothetical protein HMPREF9596_00509 [Cutibacterium acnes HL005PA3]|nr:hypothetical protein HMPREF9596_00509 [Cutibacterium acnes HL005PA3]
MPCRGVYAWCGNPVSGGDGCRPSWQDMPLRADMPYEAWPSAKSSLEP